MTATADQSRAVLAALRERGKHRNKVRAEISEHSQRGELRMNSDMPSWAAYERAEVALNAAVTEWEEAEGL